MWLNSRPLGWLGSLVSLVLILQTRTVVKAQLGLMHWCDTLCLCDDETFQKLQCFQQDEFYSLLSLSPREVSRLGRAGFDIQEKLKWCNDTCLCHKHSEKPFRCSSDEQLVSFITNTSPFLVDKLEPVEIYDLRDTIGKPEPEEIPEEVERSKHDRHQRRKMRKNRKNRRKHQEEEVPETTEVPPPQPTPLLITTPAPVVLHAGVYGESYPPAPSKSSPMRESEAELDIPLQRKTVAGEVSKDLEQLKHHVDQIQLDVELNQRILMVTVAVAAVAMIGVLILSIYSCCLRKNSSGSKSRRGLGSNPDENSITKAHLEEAW